MGVRCGRVVGGGEGRGAVGIDERKGWRVVLRSEAEGCGGLLVEDGMAAMV
jgi:hypothetical protein